MEKYLKRVLMLVIAVVAYIPVSVYAIDISQADFDAAKENPGTPSNGVYVEIATGPVKYSLTPGDYKLTDNIDLDDTMISLKDDGYNINLNGKTITYSGDNYALSLDKATVTIKGSGKIECPDDVKAIEIKDRSIVTIENGNYTGSIEINGIDPGRRPTVNIKSGTFKHITISSADVVIDNATVDSSDYELEAITLEGGGSLTINGGTYKGTQNGINLLSFSSNNPVKSLIINDGTFIGHSGMFINAYALGNSDVVKIKKATFTGISAAIWMVIPNAETLLNGFLADNSYYNPELEVTSSELETYTQKSISVISKEKEEPTQSSDIEDKNIVFLEGANEKFKISKDSSLTFKINIDYEVFADGGKVYIDDKLVDAKYYELSKGSTIIAIKVDYAKALKVGEHTIKVILDDKEASATFTITEINPNTGDSLLISLAILMLTATLLATFFASKFKKTKKEMLG